MENITYLIGAGASFNCLPIYSNFRNRFNLFRNSMDGARGPLEPDEKRILDEILNDCNIIDREFGFHNTPDTLAKKYFHQKEKGLENLDRLKRILTLFFVYEQCMSSEFISNTNLKNENKQQVDKRYDAFIASILETEYSTLKINPYVSILTWNYDVQFEICYKNYCEERFIDAQFEIQSIPSQKTIQNDFQFSTDKFSIIHLNGIAIPQVEENSAAVNIPYDGFHQRRESLVEYLVEYYTRMKELDTFGGSNSLNFAWERHKSFPRSKRVLDFTAKCSYQVAEKTTVLVVIGYSFPIFNREVDSSLFKKMTKLKRIYIQSPDADNIKEIIINTFQPINNKIIEKEIRMIADLNQFYIPNEMNSEITSGSYAFA